MIILNYSQLSTSILIIMSSKDKKVSHISSLENDVIFTEILMRLPLKSLMRFKCISKSFETVISSPDFTKLYHRFNPSELLILPEEGRIKCYDLDSATVTTTFIWQDGGPVSVLGAANGVLCIYTPNATNQLLLLNPTTRICRGILIPDFDMDSPISGYSYVQGGVGRFIGFAFDHEENDFKIVGVSDGLPYVSTGELVTHVYSLNYDSWTIVESKFQDDSMVGYYPSGTLISTHLLHWMFWSNSLNKRRIACFDVCKDKWVDDVLLPHYYYDPSENSLILLDIGVLDGRLFASFETLGTCYDVWVMKEYGVQDSWVKLFSIPDSVGIPGGVVPVVCRVLVGGVLVRQRHRTWLFWYNRIDGGMNNVKFDGAQDFSEVQVYLCRRSLVDIPGGELFGDSQLLRC